jgi:hypothetical protein
MATVMQGRTGTVGGVKLLADDFWSPSVDWTEGLCF